MELFEPEHRLKVPNPFFLAPISGNKGPRSTLVLFLGCMPLHHFLRLLHVLSTVNDAKSKVCIRVACIASVSVGLGSKERPWNGTGTVFCSREIGARAKIRKRGGEAEKRKRLRTNPWIIGSRRATEPCLQKFLAEQGFSRELPQHGGNPVVQCRRFGISKRDSATLFSLSSFSDV